MRGTHGEVRQRSVHCQVICAKRPTCRRVTVGAATGLYGTKLVVTCSRLGSTHFVSATMASLAVTGAPKSWTVGVNVAYAFSGTPSPIDEPDGKFGGVGIGVSAAAGAAVASVARAMSSTCFMRPLRAT